MTYMKICVVIILHFVGGLTIPAAIVGNLIGGIVINKLKLKVKGIIKFSLICSMISIGFAACFWITCEQHEIAGVTISYDENGTR